MKIYHKKHIVGALLFFFISLIFAEKYYVCLGSFKTKEFADKFMQTLKDENIDTFISEYKKSETEIYYRVLLDKEARDLAMSNINKAAIEANPSVQALHITGIWNCDAEKYNMIVPARNKAAEENKEVINPDEKRTFVIKDSDTGNPVQAADVGIDKKWDFKTDKHGKIYIPDEVGDGQHTVVVTKGDEYVYTDSTIVLKDGQLTSAPQISIPKTVDYSRIKVILDWGLTPKDLDSHIMNNDAHVYFRNMSDDNMFLDRDDITSYGPETITVREPDREQTYHYFVYDYTNRGDDESYEMSFSMARIRVYFDNEYKGAFQIKPNQQGCLWHVFDVIDGNLVPVDKIVPEDEYSL